MQVEQQLTVADRLSGSLWAQWKGLESTHACWFNTNTVDGESCSSRMLSRSHCSGRHGPSAEQLNFAYPGWKNETLSSLKTSWSHTLSPPVTQSRSILFHKLEHLKLCALLTGTIKDSQGQSNNILQVAAQNAGAEGQKLQPLTIFLPFHPSHLYYTFPVSHMMLRSRSAVKHNRSCSALLVSARSLNLAPLWSWAFTSPVSYSKSGGLLSKFEAHFNRIRNCRRKTHHSRLPAQTLSRNVCWKMGNYGNVIAAMPHPGSWTNMHKGWGL